MQENRIRDKFFLKLFLTDKVAVTQAEVVYFRKHPDEIDEITAPLNVHKLFLLFGALFGVSLVGVSKLLKFTSVLSFLRDYTQEFLVDIIFEIGVALIGAGVTAYLLGILLNVQQENADNWRKEIRRKIREDSGIGES
jgi:hypothetical protein